MIEDSRPSPAYQPLKIVLPLPFRVEVELVYAQLIAYRYMFVNTTEKNRRDVFVPPGTTGSYGLPPRPASTEGQFNLALLTYRSFRNLTAIGLNCPSLSLALAGCYRKDV